MEESLKAVFQFVKDKEQLLQGTFCAGEVWFAVYTLGTLGIKYMLILFCNLSRDSTSLLYKKYKTIPLPKLGSLSLV